MWLMNHILRDYISKFVVVYFDDILVYSKSLHDHLGQSSPFIGLIICLVT